MQTLKNFFIEILTSVQQYVELSILEEAEFISLQPWGSRQDNE